MFCSRWEQRITRIHICILRDAWTVCRILAENVLHESLKVKLDNLIVGSNTRQVSRVGVNKIKEMIKTVGWVPLEEYAERCEAAFEKYDFSKVVEKVSTTSFMEVHLCCAFWLSILTLYFFVSCRYWTERKQTSYHQLWKDLWIRKLWTLLRIFASSLCLRGYTEDW